MMSAAFKKKGRQIYTINVPTKSGEWIPRTTGTRDGQTARAMQRMVDELGAEGKRAWDVLGRVTEKGEAHLPLPTLYDRYIDARKDLSQLRATLEDVDIEPYVAKWLAAIDGAVSPDTAAHYKHHVGLLIEEGKPFLRSQFTVSKLQTFIDELEGSSGTKRKAAASVSSFAILLVRRKVIETNPMRLVALPKPAAPRVLYLDTPDAIRLADAQPGQFRNLSALLAGSGADVSPALKIRVRDVDKKNREIRCAGTKAYNRDRIIRVADWAWPYIEPLLAGKLPDALLFDAIRHRWAARFQHHHAIEKLEKESDVFKGYTMKDARHTYAVRAIRAGTPPELVAKQLGHSNAILVHKVYGRFAPTQHERDRWEKIASAQDAERAKEAAK